MAELPRLTLINIFAWQSYTESTKRKIPYHQTPRSRAQLRHKVAQTVACAWKKSHARVAAASIFPSVRAAWGSSIAISRACESFCAISACAAAGIPESRLFIQLENIPVFPSIGYPYRARWRSPAGRSGARVWFRAVEVKTRRVIAARSVERKIKFLFALWCSLVVNRNRW